MGFLEILLLAVGVSIDAFAVSVAGGFMEVTPQKITVLATAAELPIDIQYSKFIMIAYAFDMIEAGIVCAALLSNRKKIFKPSLKYRNDLYDTLRYFSFNSDCDIITAYLAFKQWEKKFGMRMTNNEFDTRLKYIDLNQMYLNYLRNH